jgi:hypothetical protein
MKPHSDPIKYLVSNPFEAYKEMICRMFMSDFSNTVIAKNKYGFKTKSKKLKQITFEISRLDKLRLQDMCEISKGSMKVFMDHKENAYERWKLIKEEKIRRIKQKNIKEEDYTSSSDEILEVEEKEMKDEVKTPMDADKPLFPNPFAGQDLLSLMMNRTGTFTPRVTPYSRVCEANRFIRNALSNYYRDLYCDYLNALTESDLSHHINRIRNLTLTKFQDFVLPLILSPDQLKAINEKEKRKKKYTKIKLKEKELRSSLLKKKEKKEKQISDKMEVDFNSTTPVSTSTVEEIEGEE